MTIFMDSYHTLLTTRASFVRIYFTHTHYSNYYQLIFTHTHHHARIKLNILINNNLLYIIKHNINMTHKHNNTQKMK